MRRGCRSAGAIASPVVGFAPLHPAFAHSRVGVRRRFGSEPLAAVRSLLGRRRARNGRRGAGNNDRRAARACHRAPPSVRRHAAGDRRAPESSDQRLGRHRSSGHGRRVDRRFARRQHRQRVVRRAEGRRNGWRRERLRRRYEQPPHPQDHAGRQRHNPRWVDPRLPRRERRFCTVRQSEGAHGRFVRKRLRRRHSQPEDPQDHTDRRRHDGGRVDLRLRRRERHQRRVQLPRRCGRRRNGQHLCRGHEQPTDPQDRHGARCDHGRRIFVGLCGRQRDGGAVQQPEGDRHRW